MDLTVLMTWMIWDKHILRNYHLNHMPKNSLIARDHTGIIDVMMIHSDDDIV